MKWYEMQYSMVICKQTNRVFWNKIYKNKNFYQNIQNNNQNNQCQKPTIIMSYLWTFLTCNQSCQCWSFSLTEADKLKTISFSVF